MGVCHPRSGGVNLQDLRGRLRERSVWRLLCILRSGLISWASRKREGFERKKLGYWRRRGFGCKANHGGTVVLRVWLIALSNVDRLARRRLGFDCVLLASEFF